MIYLGQMRRGFIVIQMSKNRMMEPTKTQLENDFEELP